MSKPKLTAALIKEIDGEFANNSHLGGMLLRDAWPQIKLSLARERKMERLLKMVEDIGFAPDAARAIRIRCASGIAKVLSQSRSRFRSKL